MRDFIAAGRGRFALVVGAEKMTLSFVGNLAIADRATNKLRSKAVVIVTYTGLIPGRATDDVTFGVGAAVVNGRVTDAHRAQNDAGVGAVAWDLVGSGKLRPASISLTALPQLRFLDPIHEMPGLNT
ncbi:carbohydrate porin [Brevundimonas sp.]|uniref:carbohydrate porin n=1 Tax=Brevundimonas sp. TaxID=1871086 RepID=UPI0028A0844A|nr:carbohydrate porin [Brevundimonas sp.]